jgi:hypothetical protein
MFGMADPRSLTPVALPSRDNALVATVSEPIGVLRASGSERNLEISLVNVCMIATYSAAADSHLAYRCDSRLTRSA